MEFRKELLDQTKIAVRLRENGQLVESRYEFKKILLKINSLKNSKDKNDQNTYIDIMGEWIIQLRHEAKQTFQNALEIANGLYKFSKTKKINSPKAIRGVSNTLMNMETYELAQKYLLEMLLLLKDTDSSRKGDVLAHLARCLFRIGLIDESENKINQALKLISDNTGGATKLEIAVWKSHAFIVKALILSFREKHEEAISFVKDALQIAKKEKIYSRAQDAKIFLKYLISAKND